MKSFYFAMTGFALGITSASAADVAPRAPSYIEAQPIAYSWTGFYAGLNVGYGFAAGGRNSGGQTATANNNPAPFPFNNELFSTGGPQWNSSNDIGGVVGGLQLGYNWRVNRWLVAGLETDFQGADLSGDGGGSQSTFVTLTPVPPEGANLWPLTGTASATQKIDWYGTVRGRLGVTTVNNSLLVYGTGGLAYGKVKQNFRYSGGFLPSVPLGFAGTNFDASASSSETKVGWALGAGLEWAPASMPNWSFKAEYLYVDLGSTTVDLTAPTFRNSDGQGNRTTSASNTMDNRFQTVRVGFNYHF